MIQAVLQLPFAQLDAASKRTAYVPQLMAGAFRRNITPLTQRYVRRMRVEPASGNTTGITRLMTPRQRRKVHAMRNARGGGDYPRTHGISEGWQEVVQVAIGGSTASVFNDVPGVNYVEGYDQQPFLASLGWLYAPPILSEFVDEGARIVAETWFSVCDPLGGIPT